MDNGWHKGKVDGFLSQSMTMRHVMPWESPVHGEGHDLWRKYLKKLFFNVESFIIISVTCLVYKSFAPFTSGINVTI